MPLFCALSSEKRRELKHRLIRQAQVVDHWPQQLGIEVDDMTMLDSSARVMAEVYSVAMCPDMVDIWTRLRLALCSNLASPYGPVIRHTLPNPPNVEALSYMVGAIKPDPAIYAYVLDGLEIEPGRVLFVGLGRSYREFVL